MERTLIQITFDESLSRVGDNQIYTLFLGSMVKPGVKVDTPYNHYSTLRTVEENFSLGSLDKGDKTASAIDGIWIEKKKLK